MDQLTTLLSQAFGAVDLLQGLIIAFVAAITMSRYSQILYFAIIAIIVDQFVTLAFRGRSNDSVEDISTVLLENLREVEATNVILHFIFYLVMITLIYTLRQLFRRT